MRVGRHKGQQGAYELARELDTTTDEQKDAVFRLLYYAASEGYVPAFMSYAACLDPTREPWGTIAKDPLESYTYYKKAGTGEAVAAMGKIREWATELNARGDARAARWLQEME